MGLGYGSPPQVRLAEVIAALSLATDLGMGQPMDHALRRCLLAVRLGEALSLTLRELRDVYWRISRILATQTGYPARRVMSSVHAGRVSRCLGNRMAYLLPVDEGAQVGWPSGGGRLLRFYWSGT